MRNFRQRSDLVATGVVLSINELLGILLTNNVPLKESSSASSESNYKMASLEDYSSLTETLAYCYGL